MKVELSPVEMLPPAEVPLPASLSDEIKADIIDGVADYLDQHDWCQNQSGWDWGPAMKQEFSPPACLSGATLASAFYYAGSHNIPVYAQNIQMINRVFYAPVWMAMTNALQEDPVSWNDEGSRNKQEVLDFCRALAKDLRG